MGSNGDSATASPGRRDWVDLTVRLATSWVGLFAAYVAALILALTKFRELGKGLHDTGIPPWLGIALVVAFPVLAFVFSTIPTFIDQRRVKRYSEIAGAIQTGYFTLRPRENEEGFERPDNAHLETLRWIEASKEPVLYLTGASGTGKSSLLSAWVVPKLRLKKYLVVQLRGYEQDPLARIKEELLKPGLIWDRVPGNTEDLQTLLRRATQRLGERRLLIIVDQFEEFLILTDQERQRPFQQLLSQEPIENLTFLLVFRPEYEGLIQDQSWPKLRLDTNRKVIAPFTENAAQEFMRKSGLTVNTDLMRSVLREAAEIEQTVGLIRPVTINLCGLVLGRFSSNLPRKFRGGIIRGFLRESFSLPEVRDVGGKIIPQLITDNVTKRPRTVAELAQSTHLAPSTLRACLHRLGESDRAIVRPLDHKQATWEISHDFLVPLLDAIVARRTVSLWRRVRPWLPWMASALMGIAALTTPLITRQDPTAALIRQGWVVREGQDGLEVERESPVPRTSIAILRALPPPLILILSGSSVTDVSALRELKNLTTLDLSRTSVTGVWALRELKNLTTLDISDTDVTEVSALRELKNLTTLALRRTDVTDVSPLRELKNLTTLDLSGTSVTDVSPLRELKNLTTLDIRVTDVTDVSALGELKNLKILREVKATPAELAKWKDCPCGHRDP